MKSITRAAPNFSGISRVITLTGITSAMASLLSACYVVPIGSAHGSGPSVHPPVPVLPSIVTTVARLYPANDFAKNYGVINAIVTNDLNGRGTFSTNINGESFNGEATRIANSSREGIANGAGNRGGYINCRYQMTSPSLGTGQCVLNNGALFSMHVGS